MNRNKTRDAWLCNAEVKYKIEEKNSRWEVMIIFVDTHEPTRFLIKKIADYHSRRVAEVYAENMMRTVARDVRGTQIVKKDAFDMHYN